MNKHLKNGLMATGLLVLMAYFLAVAGVRPALGGGEKITICHAAGQEGTTHFVTLTISRNAVFGPAGHFFENGTPRAGHEQDYFGPCQTDTTTTTTTDTTTTTTTTGPPRSVATAAAVCHAPIDLYFVVGEIDGNPAMVDPDTIPGSKSGITLINVFESNPADGQTVAVTTDGHCVHQGDTTTTTTTETTTTTSTEPPPTTTTETETTTTQPPTTTEPPTTTTTSPPVSQPPATKPPSSKPKPKPKPPKQHAKPKPPPACPPGQPFTGKCGVQGSG